MVNFEDEGAVAWAKIIDLGLAKTASESRFSDPAISGPGGFGRDTGVRQSRAVCKEFGADIRSDLYSLGVALWEMVTGRVLFPGSPAEVMYQHQHASVTYLSNSKVCRSRFVSSH